MIQASCVTDSCFANSDRLLSCHSIADESEGIVGLLADLSGTRGVAIIEDYVCSVLADQIKVVWRACCEDGVSGPIQQLAACHQDLNANGRTV
jgi:hypothetical protein